MSSSTDDQSQPQGKTDLLDKLERGAHLLIRNSIVRFILELSAAYVLSSVYQSFTESALWLPVDWRSIASFIMSLLAVAVAETTQFCWRRLKAWRAQRLGPLVSKLIERFVSIVCLVLALTCLWWSYELRSKCVIPFHPAPNWYDQQFGSQPKLSSLVAGPTGDNEAVGQSATADSDHSKLPLPDFINRDRAVFYVPEEFGNLKGYLVSQGKGDLRQGLITVLSTEPMLMVDWSIGSGAQYRAATTFKFGALHISIMILIAIAWGFFHPGTELVGQVRDRLIPPAVPF